MAVLALPARRHEEGRSEATRRLIISAGIEAFAARGFESTRLVSIARASWVAPSTVSMHFHGKADLFEACLREEARRVLDRAGAGLAGHPYAHLSGDFARALQAQGRDSSLVRDVIASHWGQWGPVVLDALETDRLAQDIRDEVRALCGAALTPGGQALMCSAPSLAHLTAMGLVDVAPSPVATGTSPVASLTRAALVADGSWEAVARASALWRARALQPA